MGQDSARAGDGVRMSWAKFDDLLISNPKVCALTDAPYRTYVNGIIYCCQQRTDGFIVAQAARILHPNYRKTYAAALVAAGLWHEEEGGYRVHDFHVYQPRAKPSADVISLSERGKRGAQARWKKDA